MRIFVKHGIVAVAAATLALACGNDPPARAPAPPAPAPMPNAEPHAAVPANEPAPQQQQQQHAGGARGEEDTTETRGSPEIGDKAPFTGHASAPDRHVLAKTETPLTDAQVIGVAMAANDGEIQMADLALKKATSADVKQYAQTMKTQHGSALQKEKAIESKTKITGTGSEVETYLKDEVSNVLSELRDKEGRDFDRAYIQAQVKSHRDVLAALDNRLLSSASNAEIKSQLTNLRRKVAEHLAKAEAIEKKMTSQGAGQPPSEIRH